MKCTRWKTFNDVGSEPMGLRFAAMQLGQQAKEKWAAMAVASLRT